MSEDRDQIHRKAFLETGREAFVEFLGPKEDHVRNLLGGILNVSSVARGSNVNRFYKVYPSEAGGKDAFIDELPEHLIAAAFESRERLEVLKGSIDQLLQDNTVISNLPDYIYSHASDLAQRDPHVLGRYHLRPYVADRGPSCEGMSLYLGMHAVSLIEPREFTQMNGAQQQRAASILLRDLDIAAVMHDQPAS